MRLYTLYCAIIIYAAVSSPTPDSFGIVEGIIAVLFIFAATPLHVFHGLSVRHITPPLGFHRVFLLWMLSVPLMVGVFYGANITDIIRDIIPVLALALPLAFYRDAQIKNARHLSFILMVAGCLFAARYLYMALPQLSVIGVHNGEDSLLYLANSPLVPFAGIIGFAWLSDPRRVMLSKRIIGLGIVVMCFAAMAVMVQRAPLILSVAACMGILAFRTTHAPLRSMIITGGLFLLCLPLIPLIMQIADGFINKTLQVGVNNRLDEIYAVARQSTLTGLGWGSIWQSPAVGDYWVRYTHNMPAYYWLKAGIIGLCLAIGFIYMWFLTLVKLVRHNFVTAIAIIIPFAIHVTLYTGYKTIDFALLLTLIILCNNKDRHLS